LVKAKPYTILLFRKRKDGCVLYPVP
jgi:hypothetical protein